MAEKMQIVCKCGFLLETRPFTTASTAKTTTCRNCKKKVYIQINGGKVFVSYK